MDTKEFERALRSDGYTDVEVKNVPAGTHNDEHAHPFDVRALVLDGRIALTVDGVTRIYGAGDVFTMASGHPHVEDIGEQGVRYLVGRRRSAGA
jgi:quercetin dioxygenase-like cupin family protein